MGLVFMNKLRRALIISILAGLLAVLWPALAIAKTVSCVDLKAFWGNTVLRDFQIETQPDAQFSCSSSQGKLAEALMALYQLSDLPTTNDAITDYGLWVRQRITKIKFEKIFESQEDPTVRLVIASSDQRGTLTLYDRFATRDLVKRIGTIVHEARHMDADDPGHETCLSGSLKGASLACDPNEDLSPSGGAYNYEIIFWSAVLKSNHDFLQRSAIEKQIRFIQRSQINRRD